MKYISPALFQFHSLYNVLRRLIDHNDMPLVCQSVTTKGMNAVLTTQAARSDAATRSSPPLPRDKTKISLSNA